MFAIASAVVVVVVTWIARRVRTWPWAVSLGLVLGGATTHLLDRLLREPGFARGRVVDFIDYFDLFIGNVADIALVGGIFWAALLHLRGVELSGGAGGGRAGRRRTAGRGGGLTPARADSARRAGNPLTRHHSLPECVPIVSTRRWPRPSCPPPGGRAGVPPSPEG